MSNTGIIYGVNGPVIYLKGDNGFKISEMVYVGPEHLVGEIIGLKKGMTTVQVFEETTGLKPGDTVTGTGDAISVLLGPGIIHNIFDGIQRPLEEIAKASGKYISRGVSVDSLDTEKKWKTHITVKEGDVVGPGSIIAETQETDSILHKSMVPPNLTEATVIHAVSDGEYTILEPIVTIQFADGTTRDLALAQKWPIRIPRPTHKRFPASVPLITGQRILDTLFPIAKGGTAAVPGGFGTGKTMTQHQIAGFGVDQLTEILQNLGHFISTLSTADIDDDICVRPLGDLVLGHGFSGTETTGNSGGAAFCDREHGIQDTLTCDQRPGCRETSFGRTGNTDRPFLAQGEFLCGSVGKFQCDDRIHDRVSTIRGCLDNSSLHIRRNHGSMKDTCGFLGFRDDGSSGYMIALGYGYMNIPFFGGIQRIDADTTGDIFAGAGSNLT